MISISHVNICDKTTRIACVTIKRITVFLRGRFYTGFIRQDGYKKYLRFREPIITMSSKQYPYAFKELRELNPDISIKCRSITLVALDERNYFCHSMEGGNQYHKCANISCKLSTPNAYYCNICTAKERKVAECMSCNAQFEIFDDNPYFQMEKPMIPVCGQCLSKARCCECDKEAPDNALICESCTVPITSIICLKCSEYEVEPDVYICPYCRDDKREEKSLDYERIGQIYCKKLQLKVERQHILNDMELAKEERDKLTHVPSLSSLSQMEVELNKATQDRNWSRVSEISLGLTKADAKHSDYRKREREVERCQLMYDENAERIKRAKESLLLEIDDKI